MVPETPMKLYKAYEKIFPEDLSRFKLIQKMVCEFCFMYSHQDLSDVFGFYSELDRTNEGFELTRISLRDEFDSRNPAELIRAQLKNIV